MVRYYAKLKWHCHIRATQLLEVLQRANLILHVLSHCNVSNTCWADTFGQRRSCFWKVVEGNYISHLLFINTYIPIESRVSVLLPNIEVHRLSLLLHVRKISGSIPDSQTAYPTRSLTLYVPCIKLQCVDKPTRCNTSYDDLYFPLLGSTCFGLSPVHHQEHHLINCITHWYASCYQASLARIACTNVPTRYTVYEMLLLMMDWW